MALVPSSDNIKHHKALSSSLRRSIVPWLYMTCLERINLAAMLWLAAKLDGELKPASSKRAASRPPPSGQSKSAKGPDWSTWKKLDQRSSKLIWELICWKSWRKPALLKHVETNSNSKWREWRENRTHTFCQCWFRVLTEIPEPKTSHPSACNTTLQQNKLEPTSWAERDEIAGPMPKKRQRTYEYSRRTDNTKDTKHKLDVVSSSWPDLRYQWYYSQWYLDQLRMT